MSGVLLRALGSLRTPARYTPLTFQPRRNGYIVLLPEVPDDTPETNALLRTTDQVPQYANATATMAYRAVGKSLVEYDIGLSRLEERLEDPSYPKNFESLFEPLEKLIAQLEFTWTAVMHLFLIRNEKGISQVYNKLHKRVNRAHSKRFRSPQIYRVVRELHGDIDKYDGDQKQMIQRFMLACKMNGLDLDNPSKEVLTSLQVKISEHQGRFEDKLARATEAFKQSIDSNMLKQFPEHLRQHFVTQSGSVVTLYEPQYSTFMAYCGDRRHRWNLYNASTIRASFTNNTWNNSIEIEEIRSYRQQLAKVFGYSTYADLAAVTKMTSPADHVVKTLMDLSKKIDPAAKEEVAALQSFCAEKGFKATLERWDLPYWRRRYRESRLAIDENDMRQLFSLDAVLQGTCNMVEKFFGVEMREVQSKEPLWAPDVKMFQVAVNGEELGVILMDLPNRGDKYPGSWCQTLKTRCVATGTSPVTSIVMNLRDRTSVSSSELSDFLQKLGLALQHVLSKARYIEVSGISNLTYDMANVVPALFDMLLLDKRFTRMLSAGEALPDEYHKKIVDSRLHMASVDLQEDLYLSLLDIKLHASDDYWQDVVKRFRPTLLSAFPYQEFDSYHVCSFSEIMSGGLAACFYSKVWSRMIAAELFHAMSQDCQTEAETIKAARRFRDIMLVDGGSLSAIEAFRRFCGRDPTADSLLSVMNVKTEAN